MLANVEKVSGGCGEGGTDLSGFDGSLKHCSDCGAVISLTIPPLSLLCYNERSLRGRLVTKHRTGLGEVCRMPACMASKESGGRNKRRNRTLQWNLNTFSEIQRCGADKSGNNCSPSIIKLLPLPRLNGPSLRFSTIFPLAPDVVLLYVEAIISPAWRDRLGAC